MIACVNFYIDDGHVFACGLQSGKFVSKSQNEQENEQNLRTFTQIPEFAGKKRVASLHCAFNHCVLVTGLHGMWQFQAKLLSSTWPRDVTVLFA